MSKNVRYVFCINPGRSGSHYLASLFAQAERTFAFHEAEPLMIGPFLRSVTSCPYTVSYDSRRVKTVAIRQIINEAPVEYVYVETNHMFITTFFDVVCDELHDVAVIHLRRRFIDVLKSFVELNYFSPRNTVWPDWMISPNAVTRAIDCIDIDERLTPVQLSIAYLIDSEMRALRFKEQYPSIPVYDITLDELNNEVSVRALFDTCGLTLKKHAESYVGIRTNDRHALKERYNTSITYEELHREIDAYLDAARVRGLHISDTVVSYINAERKRIC